MKFLRRAALLLLIGEPAYGQTFQFPAMVPLTPEYVVTQQMFRFIYPQSPSGGFVDVLQQSRPLSDFASSAELAQRSALFAHQMRRDFNRLSEGIALSAAVTILPPNPGDRFALTLSGTSYEGHGAASASDRKSVV